MPRAPQRSGSGGANSEPVAIGDASTLHTARGASWLHLVVAMHSLSRRALFAVIAVAGVACGGAPSEPSGGPAAAPDPHAATITMPTRGTSSVPLRDHYGSLPVADGATDTMGTMSAALTHIGDSRRVIVAFRDASDDAAGGPGMGFAYSDNDGVSWTRSVVAGNDAYAREVGPLLRTPALAVGMDRTRDPAHPAEVFYVGVAAMRTSSGALDANHTVIVMARSIDGGVTFLPPTVAAASRIDAPFRWASMPSLAADASGRLHLVFVADTETPLATLWHWVGYPGSATCSFSCATWTPEARIAIAGDEQGLGALAHPVIRADGNAVYIAYELRRTLTDETGAPHTSLRLVTLHFNPFTGMWEPTAAQPNAGQWITEGAYVAGDHALMDFTVDAESRSGRVLWIADTAGDAVSVDAVREQRFDIVDRLTERWSEINTLNASLVGGRVFGLSAGSANDAQAVAWLQEDRSTGRLRLMGSALVNGGATWSEPRNLTAIGTPDESATMPGCADAQPGWDSPTASVAYPNPSNDGGMVAMTFHLRARETECGTGAGPIDRMLAATRWTTGAQQL